MSLTPAYDEIEAKRIKDKIELCGKNRGPHDYKPIEWTKSTSENGKEISRVTRMLCRVCFCNVTMSTLLANYEDVSLPEKPDKPQ